MEENPYKSPLVVDEAEQNRSRLDPKPYSLVLFILWLATGFVCAILYRLEPAWFGPVWGMVGPWLLGGVLLAWLAWRRRRFSSDRPDHTTTSHS